MAKIVHLTSVGTTFHVRVFAKQCRSLAASGNEVVLLCTHDVDDEVDGVRIKTVGQPVGRLHRMLWITTKLLLAAQAEQADLYVIHDPELIPFAWMLAVQKNVVIYDMHENTPKQILSKHWIPVWLRKIVAYLVSGVERMLLPRLPIVYAESSYAKDYRYVKQSTIVLNMPFLGQRATKYPSPTIGYMGNVAPLRGSNITFDALDRLKQRGLSPDFECIGPISANHAKELATRSGSLRPSNIRVRGYVMSDKGWQHIARCHVGLAVLSNVPNYFESFPGKMFEYMSFGIPVVVSNFPLYREVVDRLGCGICVDPESSEDIANAIEWLLTHPQEARLMGERGMCAVENRYNWGAEYEKLLDFFDQCLESKHVRVARGLSPHRTKSAA